MKQEQIEGIRLGLGMPSLGNGKKLQSSGPVAVFEHKICPVRYICPTRMLSMLSDDGSFFHGDKYVI